MNDPRHGELLAEAERLMAEIRATIERAKARLRELGIRPPSSLEVLELGETQVPAPVTRTGFEVGGEDETPGSS